MATADQLALVEDAKHVSRPAITRRTGRPRGPDVEMVTSVRLTVEERKTLNALADSSGMTYSEVLRAGLQLLASQKGGRVTAA